MSKDTLSTTSSTFNVPNQEKHNEKCCKSCKFWDLNKKSNTGAGEGTCNLCFGRRDYITRINPPDFICKSYKERRV